MKRKIEEVEPQKEEQAKKKKKLNSEEKETTSPVEEHNIGFNISLSIASIPQLHVLSGKEDEKLKEFVREFILTHGYKRLDENANKVLAEIAEKVSPKCTLKICRITWRHCCNMDAYKNEGVLQQAISKSKMIDITTVKAPVPPLNIIRRYLKCLRWSKKAIQRFVRALGKPDQEHRFDPKFFNQCLELYKKDGITEQNAMNECQRYGKLFETEVVEWLKHQNIEFETENDLKKKTTIDKYGNKRKVKTPDILFKSPQTVNGIEDVHWIELKCSYGSDLYMMNRKWKIQVQAYKNIYGKGILAFQYGYCTNLTKNLDCLCMDFSSLYSGTDEN